MRRGAATATLIEQQHVVGSGVEEAAVYRRAPAARSAMEKDRRLALRITAELPIHAVTVVGSQVAVRIRLNLRIHSGLAFEDEIPHAMAPTLFAGGSRGGAHSLHLPCSPGRFRH